MIYLVNCHQSCRAVVYRHHEQVSSCW